MSIQSEITRLETAKSAIAAAIAGKGVTVPDGTMLDGMASLIAGIEAGGGDVSEIHGNITPDSDISVIEVEHNLGVIPKAVIYYANETTLPKNYLGLGMYILGWNFEFSNSFGTVSSSFIRTIDITSPQDGTNENDFKYAVACNATTSKVTLSNPNYYYKFKSGVEYFWSVIG